MNDPGDHQEPMNQRPNVPAKIIVKIGGSLLTRRDLGSSVDAWLNTHCSGAQVNLVVGGGGIIDCFRHLDSIHDLDPVEMHWQCVAALRQTNQLVSRLIPDCVLINATETYHRHRTSNTLGRFVIIPDTFYHPASGDDLPCDWTTTADSIAGLLCKKLHADRLVLFKSCPIPEGIDLNDAVTRGIIDPVVSSVINSDRIELVHLT